MYTLSLEIINKCNLNCTYCYLGEKKNTYMSLETAQKAIDIAVHEANKQHDRTLMVYFIGGEPLMAFNLMKDVVDYAKKKCQETNLICKFSTTINGTLVTDEVIDFFVENTFEVKVSLDGPEYVQNLNRRDYAGTGSFEKIMKNLPLLRKYEQETGNQISVASVVTSNNYQYYAESFQFLLDLGIKKLESGIDYYCSWSDEQIQGLREQIEKVFGLYKAHIQKNQEVIFWNLWEQYLKSFLIPCPFYACKAGLTTCYVTTDGGIYTCAELPEFKIGSVEAGLDVPRIREIIYLEDQEDTMCKNSCGGYGKVMAIFPEGDIYMCQCMEQNQVRMGNILSDEPQKILQELENLLKKDEIKRLFCAEYKEICKECDYRYICGGHCLASEEPYDYRCIFLKAVLNYVLFYYDSKANRRKNLEIYIEYMEEVKRRWEEEPN